ncbi:MAG: hypothetical protein WAV28_08390 [Sedimentisphaerales bacterium]
MVMLMQRRYNLDGRDIDLSAPSGFADQGVNLANVNTIAPD